MPALKKFHPGVCRRDVFFDTETLLSRFRHGGDSRSRRLYSEGGTPNRFLKARE